ncbi:MAG: hypothetical protein LLF75_04740 [Eubacteriales bacterium]|nr:hypothetical protein [Eubacteriales bacterium]
MKICSSCGAQASSRVRQCRVCGSGSFFYICENCSARFASLRCPQCGVLRESREKVCPNCGRHTFDAHCPDCGANLQNVAPVRAEVPREVYAVHAGEGAAIIQSEQEQNRAKARKTSGCGVASLVLSLIGYWSASDIGLAGLTFLVPALILFALGAALVKVNNRRIWSLIASGVLLLLSAVMLALFPAGWGK